MNRKSILSCIFFIFSSSATFAEEVTININATVMERSCTVSNGSLNTTINLQPGDLRSSKLGFPFAGTKFSISLVDCPENISTAYIKFSGESDTEMSNLLKNLDSTDAAAKGVALGLYDDDNQNININNNKKALTISHLSSINTYGFFAYYVRVSSSYSAGKILSIADFELSYD